MAVQSNESGPFTQADGAQTISLEGAQDNYPFHTVSLNHVLTSTGVETTPTTGTFLLEAQREGSNIWEPIGENEGVLQAVSEGGSDIIRVPIQAVRITPTNYDSDKSYFVTLNGIEG